MKTWIIAAEDAARYNKGVRKVLSRLTELRAQSAGTDKGAAGRKIDGLCQAIRLADDESDRDRIGAKIKSLLDSTKLEDLDWEAYEPSLRKRQIQKAILLKPWLGDKEKGVLYVSFPDQWCRLVNASDVAKLAQKYRLVTAPSWFPPHSLTNYLFPRVFPGAIFCGISNTMDLKFFPAMHSNYRMAPLYASHWVNPDLFDAVPVEQKDYDIVVVSNFAKFKRHFVLFRALQSMPKELRVLLIGQKDGSRDRAALMSEAQAYGVADRFTLVENATHPDVCRYLARSRVSVVLSKREGSCVVVAESMFANTPVGIFHDAEIGSRAFINEDTGRFLEHTDLASQLVDFVAQAGKFRPRERALQDGISCISSTAKLNALLKEDAMGSGEAWTRDITALQWAPNPRYLHPNDGELMREEQQRFSGEFGIIIGPS